MVRPAALLAMAATLCTMQRAAAFLPARLATVAARPAAVARMGALRTLAMISTEAKGAAESMEYRVFFKVRRLVYVCDGVCLHVEPAAGKGGSLSHMLPYAHARTRPREQKDGSAISPWHDIPLKADANTFNFITEIPKL